MKPIMSRKYPDRKFIGVKEASDGKNYFVWEDIKTGEIHRKRTNTKTWEQLYPQIYKTKEEWEKLENE